MATKSREVALAEKCIEKAQATLGDGWVHVSKDIRWGLVSSHILALCLSQDEGIDPRKVLVLTQAVNDIAYEIIFTRTK